KKIFANVPRFNRDDFFKAARGAVPNQKKNFFLHNLRDSRTYAQVLWGVETGGDKQEVLREENWQLQAQTTSEAKRTSLELAVEAKEMEWLSNCMVGRAIDHEKASQVPNSLLSEGFHTIQSHQMGGNLLLSLVEGEDIKDLIQDALECLNSLFTSIHLWKEEDMAEYRSTWIRCLGVPLHMSLIGVCVLFVQIIIRQVCRRIMEKIGGRRPRIICVKGKVEET
ncbi:hypothetical protein Lal_00021358, partial [Lupinus albus]